MCIRQKSTASLPSVIKLLVFIFLPNFLDDMEFWLVLDKGQGIIKMVGLM
jgi:hypothetical protein